MPNINVVVDCSSIFHRIAYYLASAKGHTYDNNDECLDLVRNVHSSLESVINQYGNSVHSVHYVFDSKPNWRTEYLRTISGNVEYKQNRKESSFNHENFIKTISLYQHVLMNDTDLFVHKYDMLESDDIISYLADHYFDCGASTIIISSDSDFKQKLKCVDGKVIAMYDIDSKKQTHYVKRIAQTDGAEEILVEDFDIDSLYNADVESNLLYVHESIQSNKEEIDPHKSFFIKVLSGDKSDNVPSVYTNQSGVSFGKQRAENLYETIKEHKTIEDLVDDDDYKIFIASEIIAMCKEKNIGVLQSIVDNIYRNLLLICLNSKYQIDNLEGDIKDALVSGYFSIHKDITTNQEKHKNYINTRGYGSGSLEGTSLEYQEIKHYQS